MDEVFQSVGFKKSVYKDLESIDIDAIFRFCKTENFQYIVDNYILSEENYKDKLNDITSFISDLNSLELNSKVSLDNLLFLALDLDFIYFSLPYFKEFINVHEVHELHYLLKKIIYFKIYPVEDRYLATLFFDSKYSYDYYDDTQNTSILNINFKVLIYHDECLEYISSKNSMDFSYDWKGRPNAPLEIASVIKFVSQTLLSNRTFFKKIIKQDYYLIRYINQLLSEDKNIFNHARGVCLEISKNLNSKDHEFIPIYDFHPLNYFNLKNDRDSVFLSVFDDGRNLKIASKLLQDDDLIVLEAVSKYGLGLEFASDRLKDNILIIQAAIQQNPFALKFASQALRDDFKIVQSAIEKSGITLQYASLSLRDNMELVLYAISNNGRALEYASDNLKDDIDLVKKSISLEKSNLKYASNRLKKILVNIQDNS
jgi:hypothetical protein